MPDAPRLHRLHDAVVEMLGELDLASVGDVIVRTAIQSEGVDAAALMLAHDGADELTILAQRGLSERYAAEQRVPLAAARASYADLGTHVLLDLRREGLGDRALVAAEGLAKVLAVPVVHAGAFVGSLNLYTKDPGREFDEPDIDVARILAAHAGAALSSARLYSDAVGARELQTAFFETLAEPVLVARPPGVLYAANAAARALVGVADLIGRPLDAVSEHVSFRAASDDALVEPGATPLARALRGEEVTGEYRVTDRATGEDRTLEVSARPVRDAERRIVAAVSALHDVSAARAAEREKDEFVSMVSHELKTPLTPLKALAQLLRARARRSRAQERPLDLDSFERNLLTIERQVDRMNRLVTDLLEVSRAGRGRFELVPRPFDLAAAVREVAQRYAEAAGAEGPHRFEVRTPDRVVIDGDQARLEQVLMNLLDNAVKYSPRGGLVRVALEPVLGGIELVVSDEGIGITAADLARIGRPFVRGTGRAATFAGLGVGLHVCQLVAARHGGSLEVESAGEDRGTVARLRLPLRR